VGVTHLIDPPAAGSVSRLLPLMAQWSTEWHVSKDNKCAQSDMGKAASWWAVASTSSGPWRSFMKCKLSVGGGSCCQRTTGSNILQRASEFW